MYFDIIGSFPLELLVHVVKYLDLEDIVRSHGVSKKWRMTFSCKAIISPFLCETLEFLDLDQDGITTDEAIDDAMKYFRWRLGLQYARPVRKIYLPWKELESDDDDVKPDKPFYIQHHSRSLCFCIPHYYEKDDVPTNSEVEMLNLETGDRSIWTGRQLDIIDCFASSDRYLVMASRHPDCGGLFAAWNLQTKQKINKRIRSIRSPFTNLFTIVEDKVIIINGQNDIIFSKSESGWPDDPCPVYVWDLSSNHVQEIGEFTYFIELCHLDVQENTLVVFETVWETNPLEVHKTKWSTTTGQLLEEKVLHLPLPADGPLERSSTDRGRFRIYGSKSVAHSIWSNKDSKVWFYLEYNHSVDKLNVRSIHCCEPPGLHYYEVSGARLTRDLFYSFSRKKADYVAVYDASTGKATWHSVRVSTGTSPRSIPEQSWEESVPYWSEYAYYGFPNKYEVFGDREVFGFAGTHGVELWFFNPDYVPDPRDWKWLWGEIPMLDASQARS